MVTDSCPNCLLRHVRPARVRHGVRAVRYGYQCSRCSATWVTDYSTAPYGIADERKPELWST